MRSTTMSPERRQVWLGLGLLGAGGLFYLALPAEEETHVVVPAPVATRAGPPALPAPEPEQAAAAVPDLSGLRLHGLTATGAIIASSTGQRLVRLGREVIPGVTLSEVRQHHALLTTAAGRFELGFLGLADAAASVPATSPTQRTVMASAPARRTEVLQYRFGLAARRDDGRITGFAVRSGADMPSLQRAGLRAGDVLVGVNGQTFDSDEKVMELATEIAGSYTAEFEFERNGRRMKALLPVNPRG